MGSYYFKTRNENDDNLDNYSYNELKIMLNRLEKKQIVFCSESEILNKINKRELNKCDMTLTNG